MLRSPTERKGGAMGSENVGMSNRNAAEKAAHRKPKVSLATVFDQGLGGPKAQLKSEANGQSVNIPTLQPFFEE